MKTDWIKPLIGRPGPFATVYLDATRSVEAGDKDVIGRWKAVRRTLAQQGAPDGVLDAVEDAALRPSRKPGAHGRVIIADGDGVLVDKALRTAPAVATGVWHRVPALLQAALAADEEVTALKVAVDRTGADLVLVGPGGWDAPRTFEAPHDDVSKVDVGGSRGAASGSGGAGGGDRGGSAAEARAEDSWARNADAIAREVERTVAAARPEIVLLFGDVRTVRAVHGSLVRPVAELTVEVSGGGRGAGVHEGAFAERLEGALDSYRERRREVVLSELRQGQGREQGAVTGVDDVVAVLARGQVKALVLSEDVGYDGTLVVGSEGARGPLNGRTLWIGPDPLAVATSRATLEDAGYSDGLEELPAAIALVRAAVGQDAVLTIAPEGSAELIEGVGATLRWSDGSTPHEVAATMSHDAHLLR
ncbi:hypothetical protein Xcel_1124 [Xylanimonas cellulosilytica DSM 15894]|uniref:Peptide chain release factor 1 n=1 Tax=Xylanimonas cellulosilytica (strain DSM 15894 / JCM 12276 / CECT 5975 / KCTC 9989 / LMG 20990 / NBRC 107835 / XIL07) TaxID=446471 RepID=D1BZK1_XYLCX|nr:hypothetical protein [Xylanimonas cellulosilytica]ACZ30155.1 hypothetical protein Xcel_1124 [Xylanimonas cellulosilytica DSM 15894]